jgi:hypothetical protein
MYSDLFKSAIDVFVELEKNYSARRSSVTFTTGNCAEVTISPIDSTYPKVIVIDFGDTSCTGIDGRQRKGKLTATITGRYRDQGTVMTIETDNYIVNGYKIEGDKKLENLGRNSAGKLEFSISVANGEITQENEDWRITWSSNRVRTWLDGEDTPFDASDDVFIVSGTAQGENRNGRAYTANITSDLRIELDCEYVVEGELTIEPENLKTRVIDYGDGECDNDIEVDIDGKIYQVSL